MNRRSLLVGMAVMPLSWPSLARAQQGARVLHIDSYHQGNAWNDRIAAAALETFQAAGVETMVFHMDTKRHPSEEEKEAAALKAKEAIEAFQPDLVTTSDDNAVKYLLQPYYKDSDLPFVFSGLNWDASIYGLPYQNTTGMVEVSPIPQIIKLLKLHAKGNKVGFLAEDTPTKHKEVHYHQELFNISYDKTYFVSSFAEWKEAFIQAQSEVDMLVFFGVGALTDWNEAEALKIAEENTRIPSGTDFSWLAPYTLLAVAKVPEEQGRWAAQAALKVLEGVEPSSIPLTYNTEGELIFNKRIASRLDISDVPPLAKIIN
ncbi:MAG: ABC transporter substrate binding protein [Pseudomonadota bacterium]